MNTALNDTLRFFGRGLLLLLIFAGSAYAVDGVIEINQASVGTGGVTPGFPVTISESGTYRLTGNLSVPGADTTAIEIITDDVTLDLNGFGIFGPTVCSGSPLGSSPSGNGRDVDGDANDNITIVNGTVRGMGNRGISIGSNSRIERVRTISNGNDGIHAGDNSTVTDNTASSNDTSGIVAHAGSTVTGNAVRDNVGFGLTPFSGAGFVSNVVSGNAGGTVGGVAFDDEDILEFDPGLGTWAVVYDGSADHAGWVSADLVAVQALAAESAICDSNGDGAVDLIDINAIVAARNVPASPGDPRDLDGDGVITGLDARKCVLLCTNPRCVP